MRPVGVSVKRGVWTQRALRSYARTERSKSFYVFSFVCVFSKFGAAMFFIRRTAEERFLLGRLQQRSD